MNVTVDWESLLGSKSDMKEKTPFKTLK